jgi:hypothetical protein
LQSQRVGIGPSAFGVGNREVPRQVSLADEKQDRCRRLVFGRDGTDDHLIVGRDVQVDAAAVGDEDFGLGRFVIPPHLAGLLHLYDAALALLFSQQPPFGFMHEISGEVADRVVFLLKRGGNLLSRRKSRSLCRGQNYCLGET